MISLKNKAPGVYFDEFTPGAPIQGIGTSTPAFLGPTAIGPLNTPIFITSWDLFLSIFGKTPSQEAPYLWYAVRSFFTNGGSLCYVVRVSTAKPDFLILNDSSTAPGQPLLRLEARASNPAGNISVSVDRDPAVNTSLFVPTGTLSKATTSGDQKVSLQSAAEAASFRPGDNVLLEAPTPVTVGIKAVAGDTLHLTTPLSAIISANTNIRLANPAIGDTSFRLQSGENVFPGSILILNPGPNQEVIRVARIEQEYISPTVKPLKVFLSDSSGLSKEIDLSAPVTVESWEFTITLTSASALQAHTLKYSNLSMDPEHPNYFESKINFDDKGLLTTSLIPPPRSTTTPESWPRQLTSAASLDGGTPDNPAALSSIDYESALAQIAKLKDISLVVIPGETRQDIQRQVLDHCQLLQTRFAIFDSPRGAPPANEGGVDTHRNALDSPKGFAALYYPWITVPAAVGTGTTLIPPSGAVAGIYARTDERRGVHKAPAGEEAVVMGALGVERPLSDNEHGILNEQGINVLRVYKPGGRPMVGGARTTATDTNWRFINTRRLFIYLEGSLEVGLRWSVFEPNNLQLWQKMKRTITDFLTRAWRDGALFGSKREEAFYVRIDEALNPFAEQQLGRLHLEIGVRPTYPAEFVVVSIGIWDGGSEVNEG